MNTAMPKKDATRKEQNLFVLSGGALAMISFIVGSYFMQYLTEILLIDVGIAGLIVGLMRAFDAINDPIMGVVVDKTRTRYGRSKPYLIFLPLPLILAALFIFAPFTPGKSSTLVYVIIAYVLYTIAYTMYDIPYWSMTSRMIINPQLRVKTISRTKMLSNAVGPIAIVLFINLVTILKPYVGSTQAGYFYSLILFAVLALPVMLLGGFAFRERVGSIDEKSASLSVSLKAVFSSRPMVVNIVAGLLACVASIGGLVMNTYFIKWNMWSLLAKGDSKLVNMLAGTAIDPVAVQGIFTVVIGIMPTLAAIVGLWLTPMLSNKFSKKDVIIVSGIVGGVINILAYFLGYSNLVLFIIVRFVVFVPMGIFNGMFAAIFTDTIDYVHWKSGIRADGTCFSVLTFLSKFAGSIASVLAGLMLSLFSFNKNLQTDIDTLLSSLAPGEAASQTLIDSVRAIQQPASALNGIFIMITILMGVGQILLVIPYFFSDLTNEKMEVVKNDLEERASLGGEDNNE